MGIAGINWPLVCLVLLPILGSVWQIPSVLVVSILLILGVWDRIRRIKELLEVKSEHYILESISVSHYVEKVRWALDRLETPYVEKPDIGIFGLLFKARTVPVLKAPSSRVSIGNSSDILRYLWGVHCTNPKASFLEPTEEALELEAQMDKYGEHVRRWGYYYILEEPAACKRFWGLYQDEVPKWQRRLLTILFPFLRSILKRLLRINEKGAAKSLNKVLAMYDQMDQRLSDGRAYLLGGEEPSFVDLTWASLSSVILMPEQYGGGAIEESRPQLSLVPETARKVIEELRQRPAGAFALKMYHEIRTN